jgi:hypothetical protein
VLGGLRPGTYFEVYPISADTDIMVPLVSGRFEIGETTLDRKPEKNLENWRATAKSKINDLYQLYTSAKGDKQSCIINSMETIRNSLSSFRGRLGDVSVDIIFVSDMIEECRDTLLGHAVALDKRDIKEEINSADGFKCGRPVFAGGNTRIGVIVPAATLATQKVNRDRRPSLGDRRDFWVKIFASCGFAVRDFDNDGKFSFGTGVPGWLNSRQ